MELVVAAQETQFPWISLVIIGVLGAAVSPIGGWLSRKEGSSVAVGTMIMGLCGLLCATIFVLPAALIMSNPSGSDYDDMTAALVIEVHDVYGLDISEAGAETLLEGVEGDEEERVGEVLRFGSIEVVTSATESVEVQLAWRDSTWLLLDEDGEPLEPLTPAEGWN